MTAPSSVTAGTKPAAPMKFAIHRKALAALLFALLHAPAACPAEEPASSTAGSFAFAIPVLADKVPAFDLRGFNEKTAGENGWLRADGERFADAKGNEFRIFGTNLTAAACFPEESAAGPLARHLARFGYNMVRLHFLDNSWGPGVPSLVPVSNNITRDGLRQDALARLDRFVAELRAAGIRVNINLHVGRSYPGWQEGMPLFGKGVGYFMPDHVAELKAYCRALLTHVNPHTGLAYKDDPAVSVLEITNEDTLVENPDWLTKLLDPFAAELRKQWVAWLREKHRNTERLRSLWGIDSGPTGPELAPPLVQWQAENHRGAASTVAPSDDGGVRWVADKPGSDTWHLQFRSGRTGMESGKCYEIRFRARSSTGNTVGFYCGEAGGAWRRMGALETLTLGRDWKTFVFRIAPERVDPAYGVRLVFSLLNRPGTVEITGMSCRETNGGFLKPGQSLEAGNVPFALTGAPLPVRLDAMAFLTDLENRFVTNIRGFLKNDLGCRALVANSQVCFGGPLGALREMTGSDFVDTHGYWQHPHWPGKPWDPANWTISNSSQILSPDGGTLAALATQRPLGKPFTVSEYDLPAPSDYAAEMWPMFAAMASFQGWAGIYHYTFAHKADDFGANRITGYFNEAGHPAKDGMRPAAACMFRLGLVAPARQRHALAAGARDLLEIAARMEGNMPSAERHLWTERAGTGTRVALRHGIGLDIRTNAHPPAWSAAPPQKPGRGPVESDSGEWTWNTEQGSWILKAPAARAWSGRIGGGTHRAGDVSLTLRGLPGDPQHATVVLVAMDGKAVAQSGRLLLTAMRRAENRDMRWREDRQSVGKEWGSGPVRVIGIHATLKLPDGGPWHATPLDSAGQRRGKSAAMPDGSLEISPASETIWWMIEK